MEPWSRPPLDSLEHAYRHLVEDTESSRRHALIGFDHSIEVGVLCFLGSVGAGDQTPEAAEARQPRKPFWTKTKYIAARARLFDVVLRVPDDDMNFLRTLRNDIQHGLGWIVPSSERVELARQAVVDSLSLLGLRDLEARYPAVPRTLRVEEPVAQYDEIPRQARLPRRVSEAAWILAREVDPESEGVHIRYLAERLAQRGFQFGRRDQVATVYDAVRRDKRRFAFAASLVYRWTPVDNSEEAAIPVPNLRDACYAAARFLDPEGKGVRTDHIYGLLEKWRVPIGRADPAAAVRKAVSDDDRFHRVGPATYRWK